MSLHYRFWQTHLFFSLVYGTKCTHLPLVPLICVSELGYHWLRYWFGACSAPSHYLSQHWIIVQYTIRDKLLWNLNKKTKLFIHKSAPENTACEMAAILSTGDDLIYLFKIQPVVGQLDKAQWGMALHPWCESLFIALYKWIDALSRPFIMLAIVRRFSAWRKR